MEPVARPKLQPIGPGDELGRLKTLLFRPESRRLEDVEAKVGALDSRVGAPDRLEVATAEVLVEALRRAEVAQHRQLSQAIAPVVVAAIRNEIKNSRDMMVEALYPITGRLVSAGIAVAMAELVAAINARMDSLMSPRSLGLRFQAWRTGRSFSELALAQTQPGRLVRLLFLERGSGILLGQWQAPEARDARADLLSGMIAALTNFARDALGPSGGELRTLDLGASKIYLRTSARMIVAAEYAGFLRPAQERRLDAGFLDLLDAQERGIQPTEAGLADLADALSVSGEPAPARRGPSPVMLLALAAAVLLGWFGFESWRRSRLEARVAAAAQDVFAWRPELAAYPLKVETDHAARKVTLRALLPDEAAQSRLQEVLAPAAEPYAFSTAIALVTPQDEATRLRAKLAALSAELDAAKAEADAQMLEVGGRIEAERVERRQQAAMVDHAQTARLAKTQAALAGDVAAVNERVDGAFDLGHETRGAIEDDVAKVRALAENLQARADASDRLFRQSLDQEREARRIGLAALEGSAEARAGQVTAQLTEIGERADLAATMARSLADRVKTAADALTREQADREAAQARVQSDLAAVKADLDAPRARLEAALKGFAIFFEENDILFDEPIVRQRLSVIAALAANAGGLRIVGHADSKGAEDRRLVVSRDRAEAVARILAEFGLDRRRMVIIGVGRASPIEEGPSGSERRNRRVTLEPLFERELPP